MEWFASLFKSRCPFCDLITADCRQACATCGTWLTWLEQQEPVCNSIDGLSVVSAMSYEGWARSLILRQKNQPRRSVTRWLAGFLVSQLPREWRGLQLAWVPARKLGAFHLVEALVLELEKLGTRPLRRPALTRKLGFSQTPPQKALDRDARQEVGGRYGYVAGQTRRDQPILLLDDVMTTGATLRECRRLLENNGFFKVVGAVTLAYTPRHSSRNL